MLQGRNTIAKAPRGLGGRLVRSILSLHDGNPHLGGSEAVDNDASGGNNFCRIQISPRALSGIAIDHAPTCRLLQQDHRSRERNDNRGFTGFLQIDLWINLKGRERT